MITCVGKRDTRRLKKKKTVVLAEYTCICSCTSIKRIKGETQSSERRVCVAYVYVFLKHMDEVWGYYGGFVLDAAFIFLQWPRIRWAGTGNPWPETWLTASSRSCRAAS